MLALQPVLQYTDGQINDFMHLRRFMNGKLGQLARERRAVLTKMTWSQVDACHPSDKLSKLSTWAEQLQRNGAEEYRTYGQWAIAVFRGVRLLLPCIQQGFGKCLGNMGVISSWL